MARQRRICISRSSDIAPPVSAGRPGGGSAVADRGGAISRTKQGAIAHLFEIKESANHDHYQRGARRCLPHSSDLKLWRTAVKHIRRLRTIDDRRRAGDWRTNSRGPTGGLMTLESFACSWAARWYRENRGIRRPDQIGEVLSRLYVTEACSTRAQTHKSLEMPDWKTPVAAKGQPLACHKRQSKRTSTQLERVRRCVFSMCFRARVRRHQHPRSAALLGEPGKSSLYYHIEN